MGQHLLTRIANGFITLKLLRTTVLVIYKKKKREKKVREVVLRGRVSHRI